MGRVIKKVLSYLLVLTMVFGVVGIGWSSTVSAAEVDVNGDLIKMIAILMDEDLAVREDVLTLITTADGDFNANLDEADIADKIGAVELKSGKPLSDKISVDTIENALKDAKTYYKKSDVSAAYINYAIDKLGQELHEFTNKENAADNELVARIEAKALSYKLFLNFIYDIKEMTKIKPLYYYTDTKKLDINPALEALIDTIQDIAGFSQLERFEEYKDLLVNDYLIEVNNWPDAGEKSAFISDLNELGLYVEKTPGTPSGGGGGGAAPASGTIGDGVVDITTNPDGEKVATVTISQQAIDNDIADALSANVSLDLTGVKDVAQVIAELTGAMIDKIADSGKGLEIKTENATLVIPIEIVKAISQATGNEKITISIAQVKNAPAVTQSDMKIVGQVFEFVIKAENSTIGSFEKKIKVEMKVDLSKANDPRKIIASYYNEASKQWEPVNGYVDKQTGILVFFADHFSKYAAMEYNVKFSDVDTAWAKDSIEVLAARNIMTGVASDKFNPKANITRAEVAAILVRALNLDLKAATGKFSDVAATEWYADEVETAAKAGIINGIGDNKFDPKATVTREQIAAMMYRFLQYKDGTIVGISGISFIDAASVSPYAKNAVAVVASRGIVKGIGNKFMPSDKATREQVAVMLYRLLETMGEMQ